MNLFEKPKGLLKRVGDMSKSAQENGGKVLKTGAAITAGVGLVKLATTGDVSDIIGLAAASALMGFGGFMLDSAQKREIEQNLLNNNPNIHTDTDLDKAVKELRKAFFSNSAIATSKKNGKFLKDCEDYIEAVKSGDGEKVFEVVNEHGQGHLVELFKQGEIIELWKKGELISPPEEAPEVDDEGEEVITMSLKALKQFQETAELRGYQDAKRNETLEELDEAELVENPEEVTGQPRTVEA